MCLIDEERGFRVCVGGGGCFHQFLSGMKRLDEIISMGLCALSGVFFFHVTLFHLVWLRSWRYLIPKIGYI